LPEPVKVFGIFFAEEMQGLMMIGTLPVPSRLSHEAAKCALYIEYLESAPWNLAEYVGSKVRYGNIGTTLLRCAIQASVDAGCGGSIALHALPNAETFYEKRRFENLGFDADEGYIYFELSEASAKRLLTGEDI
jgi:hypothetical protein